MLKKFLIVLVFFGFIAMGYAFDISSNDPIEYNDSTGELMAKGNAKIVINDTMIVADEITFQKEQSLLMASGNVRIDSGAFYGIADSVSYDLEKDLLHANKAKAKYDDYCFSFDSLEYNRGHKFGANVKIVSNGMGETLNPSLTAKKFEISKDGLLTVEDARFNIGAFPVFLLPRAKIKLTNRPFSLEPKFSVNKANGPFWQNDFYFGVRPGLKIGGLFDLYEKRGVLIGPRVKFKHNSTKNQIYSKIMFGFIKDGASAKIRGHDILYKQIPNDRFFGRFSHKQHYGDRIDVVADATLWSDSEVERDFRKSWYKKHQQPYSFAEAAYRGDNYIISAFSHFEPNNYYKTLQRLPELRIDCLPTKILDSKFVHRGYASVARVRGVDFRDLSKRSSYRSDFFYGISLPLNYGDFATFTPVVNTRALVYNHNLQEGHTHGKGLVQTGFDLNFKFNGKSDYSNEIFGINGLKHTIDAIVQYRVMPSSSDNLNYPKLDMTCFSTEIPSIDIDDMRNSDELQRQNMVRFGLKNNLFTRSNGYIPRKLARFDIFQDIRFARNRPSYEFEREKKFSDTYLIGGLYPVSWFSFDVYSRVDPSRLNLHELKTSTSLNDGDFWRLSLNTKYLKFGTKITEEYGLTFNFNLSSRTSISLEEIYDAKIKKFSKQRVSLSTILWSSWLADIGVTVRENVKREDRFQFDWYIRLLDF